MHQPDLLEALFDVLLEWEMMRTNCSLQEGIDVMVHMAWYEGTVFWTPKSFRRFIKPRLRSTGQQMSFNGCPVSLHYHQRLETHAGMTCSDLGIDCISGIDPVQDKTGPERSEKTNRRQSVPGGGAQRGSHAHTMD